MSEQETTTPLPPPRRRWWVKALLVAVVFLCGMVCGGGIAAVALGHIMRDLVRHPGMRVDRSTTFLTRQLDLTPEQRQQVRVILLKQSGDMQQLRAEVWPRVLERLDKSESEIAAVLTPEQKEKWKTLAGRLREDWLPPPPVTEREAAPAVAK